MADHAGAAGAVDDVERLAEILLQQCRDDARGGVGAAARAPWHDHRNGARRIGLGKARSQAKARGGRDGSR